MPSPSSPEKAAEYLQSDLRHLVHSLHNRKLQQAGHVWVRGEGPDLYDSDGKRFVDAHSGLWNVVAGHGRPERGEAAAQQKRQLPYCSSQSGGTNSPASQLA